MSKVQNTTSPNKSGTHIQNAIKVVSPADRCSIERFFASLQRDLPQALQVKK